MDAGPIARAPKNTPDASRIGTACPRRGPSFQAPLARLGEGLGYDADQIIIDHGGKLVLLAVILAFSSNDSSARHHLYRPV